MLLTLVQESTARLEQYSSFCIEAPLSDFTKQKIHRIYPKGENWIIEAFVKDRCVVRLYPNHTVEKDTLKIEMLEITEYQIALENGDKFMEELEGNDCLCLYEVKLEFSLENIRHVVMNEKLRKSNAFD
jgi:hypothetical protein